MNNVRGRLDEADSIKNDTSTFLNQRFEESDQRMKKGLSSVLKEQSEQAVFAAAVHQTVLQVTQNNQAMLHNMINDLKLLERQINQSAKEINKESSDISKGLQAQIKEISSSIDKIPTEHPEQVKTDLSPVLNGLRQVSNAVKALPKSIPEVVIPKPMDYSNDFKRLLDRLDKRVHVFEIERDPHNELVKSITVKTK